MGEGGGLGKMQPVGNLADTLTEITDGACVDDKFDVRTTNYSNLT